VPSTNSKHGSAARRVQPLRGLMDACLAISLHCSAIPALERIRRPTTLRWFSSSPLHLARSCVCSCREPKCTGSAGSPTRLSLVDRDLLFRDGKLVAADGAATPSARIRTTLAAIHRDDSWTLRHGHSRCPSRENGLQAPSPYCGPAEVT